jgi:hypothetical protein
MVRQYYVPQVTQISQQELQSVFDVAEPPVCLLGGWAVHFHVNDGFQQEHGRAYIGSRDIDLGIHVDPDWTAEQLTTNSIGRTLEAIEALGYDRSRFGFSQAFHRDDNERLSTDTARDLPQHEIFEVYIDIIPDTTDLDPFQDAFGFRPPAEALLNPVFERNHGQPLSEVVSEDVSADAEIVPPELLAAMKIRSLPDRDKSHKRVKDVADLHALLWYTKPYNEITTQIQDFVTDDDLHTLEAAITGANATVFEDAGNLLQIDSETIRASIMRLLSTTPP